MSQPSTIRFGSIFHRILVFGGSCLGLLLLFALIFVWYRGKVQEARVVALLAVAEDASIQAEYGPYQYQQPWSSTVTLDDGTVGFQIVTRGCLRPSGYFTDDPPPYLGRIVPIVGEHCFARVTDIHVNSEQFSYADVDLLLAFPDLRALDLSHTAITDVGFNRLISHSPRLVELDVGGTKISAAAMLRLTNCRELKEIGLSDAAIEEQLEAELQRSLPDCWIR